MLFHSRALYNSQGRKGSGMYIIGLYITHNVNDKRQIYVIDGQWQKYIKYVTKHAIVA